jgi:DivIVA domain-containing protein
VPSGRPLRSDDLRDVRFSTAVRGYRMDEVDALIARIRADMIVREAESPAEAVRVVDSPVGPPAPPPPSEARSGDEPAPPDTEQSPMPGRSAAEPGDPPSSAPEPTT